MAAVAAQRRPAVILSYLAAAVAALLSAFAYAEFACDIPGVPGAPPRPSYLPRRTSMPAGLVSWALAAPTSPAGSTTC